MVIRTLRCLRSWSLVWSILALLALLAGCVTPAPAPPENPVFARVTDPAARRQLQRGKPLAAADIYSARAAKAKDPQQRQDYLLTAAEILFDRALLQAAIEKLAAVPEQLETMELQQRRDIIKARALLYEGDALAALAALPNPDGILSALHRARVFETRAQSYAALQDPDSELVARLDLDAELSEAGIIERSQASIWHLLTTQPLSTLRGMTTNVRGDVYQGWIELALTNAESGTDSMARRDGFELWQSRFQQHPANGPFVTSLLDPDNKFQGFEIGGESIDQIAVLLPLSSSNTAAAAAAIRDGLIAAYQHSRDSQNVPALRFYDIGENTAYARTAYENAVADGANAVIGPLRKQAVAAIATQRQIPVPTITLNSIDSTGGTVSPKLVQFGLAPEDEARSAASRAIALSYKNAIVLQTDDSRGDREARAFQETMFAYGGDVVHLGVLPIDEYDYSEQIREALEINSSDQRFRSLSNTIGQKLFFEPAIRNDVDVIFLALTSEQARSVRPQLDFFRARGVPRFGTSRIASLDDNTKKNKDLNTIFYADAPWVIRQSMAKDPLRQEILDNFKGANGVYAKLYALGIDAYRIVTNLDAISQGKRLEGYTGDLELTAGGRIQRHLDWAQYQEGVSVPVKRIEADPLQEIVSGRLN
ncbi:MAG: penicillin-binding protein activator [Granulosicoccus sp.]